MTMSKLPGPFGWWSCTPDDGLVSRKSTTALAEPDGSHRAAHIERMPSFNASTERPVIAQRGFLP